MYSKYSTAFKVINAQSSDSLKFNTLKLLLTYEPVHLH